MFQPPNYQNKNIENNNNSKNNNFCYIVTPSTPSLTLSIPASTSINTSFMNNFEQNYLTKMSDNSNINTTTSVNVQPHLTYVQNTNGIISPPISHSSLSNQIINESTNIILTTTSNPTYVINAPTTYYNQNPVSQSQTLTQVTQPIVMNSYVSEQNNYIQQIPSPIQNPIQNQIQTPIQNPIQNLIQSPIQITTQQVQSIPSNISHTNIIYPKVQQIPVVSYQQQPVIVSNIPFNKDMYNQNQMNSNVIYNTNCYAVNQSIPASININNSPVVHIINQQNLNQSTQVYTNSNENTINNCYINTSPILAQSNIKNENKLDLNLYKSLSYNKCSDKDEVRHQKVRFEGDIYTPKLVRYSGNAKEGFCDQCNPGRWLQLKNSAYWYHKQFFHGVSSISGKPFEPPLSTKIVDYKEMLEIVSETEKTNIIDNFIGNKNSKKDTNQNTDYDDLSIIINNDEFLQAFKNLISESTITLPNDFNFNDCILKFVVGQCHQCKEWIPLMLTKKKCTQFFTHILKYKHNDNIPIEKINKNGKPLNKYYLKKKYNMFNDKKNITEAILSYLQQIKQNKQEINDIVKNNGMTMIWYKHAHKCHQYVKPKINTEDAKNEDSTSSIPSSTSSPELSSSIKSINTNPINTSHTILPSPMSSIISSKNNNNNNKRKLSEDNISNDYKENKKGKHI